MCFFVSLVVCVDVSVVCNCAGIQYWEVANSRGGEEEDQAGVWAEREASWCS